ncbi:MAG: hypothetical protein KDA96_07345 [Planctomycetaceae bacterium]|nr:hypothetical protein [Planctomycetaceae bacterium]
MRLRRAPGFTAEGIWSHTTVTDPEAHVATSDPHADRRPQTARSGGIRIAAG